VPVAASCNVKPTATDDDDPVIAIELTTASVTVIGRVWLTDPFSTPTVAVPVAIVVTSPEALTVRTFGLLELQLDSNWRRS
jgi:hypothetical protein